MNRGEIPGFYYDEEKKKYFKIQANHLVSKGSKYAKGHVKQEQRQAKRRKTELKKQADQDALTVTRSHVLRHPLFGGAGLQREQGYQSIQRMLGYQDAAILSQWRPRRMPVRMHIDESNDLTDLYLHEAHYLSSTSQMLTAMTHAYSGLSALHVRPWNWETVSEKGQERPHAIAAFNSTITCISTYMYNDVPRVIACAGSGQRVGNIYMGVVPQDNGSTSAGMYLTLGSNASITASAIHQNTGMAAIMGTTDIFVLQADALYSGTLPLKLDDYTPSIDWLDENTVVYGSNPEGSGNRHVMLWDVRTASGTSQRFSLKQRITGVLNPRSGSSSSSWSPNNTILASTNHRIDVLDTRMPKENAPLLSFKHIHEGPQLQYTANGLDLIAAVDRDNVVQMYSTRTGKKVTALIKPTSWRGTGQPESTTLKKLLWYNDCRGVPMLQGCLGNGVVRWTWDGGDEMA